MKRNYEMDMCSGPILGKLLTFTIPLIFSGILQLLFNAADVIVVGRFAGSQSLAAVGSTTALILSLIHILRESSPVWKSAVRRRRRQPTAQ